MKILNLNAWLMPMHLSSQNKKRLKKILDLIHALEPEVITLQEVWPKSSLKKLKKMMQGYTVIANPNKLFNASGLVTLSKLPVLSNKLHIFKPTKHYKLYERLVKKGFMVTKVDYDGKQVDIVNTHLHQSDPGSKNIYKQVTKQQFTAIERHCFIVPRPLLVLGDFNMHYDELKKVNHYLKLPNAKPITTVAQKNKLANKRLNKTRIPARQLDYVMYHENGKHMNVAMKVFDLEVSDHYPLLCTVSFGK
ncbi:hypothetical protein C4573_03300 [Candidatus Woesearchaeota archaeon]|nr:MAG: hypothetical protein C4573_03300 [Candidatus Woesearchaeota archaeon]